MHKQELASGFLVTMHPEPTKSISSMRSLLTQERITPKRISPEKSVYGYVTSKVILC